MNLNLHYDDSIEYYFDGVFSNGIGNWVFHYGTLSWDDYTRKVDCKFNASYSQSTLSGTVRATSASADYGDLQVKSSNVTTHSGHPALEVTLTVENASHWWSFGGTSKTARVIVYCTEWSDTIKIGSYNLGRIYYNT